MKRSWIGIALLSVSWIAGLGYYHHADWVGWGILVALGTVLLIGRRIEIPRDRFAVASLLALIPTVFMAPWPLKLAVIFLASGVTLSLATIPRRWPFQLGSALLLAGSVLLAQGAALYAYQSWTSRSHDLPYPLVHLVGWVAQAVGIDSAPDSGNIALHSMRKLHRLGATWELLLDPATFLFLAGAFVLILLRPASTFQSPGRSRWFHRPFTIFPLFVATGLWLPIRAGLMMSLLVHRALRVDYDAPLILMDQFRNLWIMLALLAVPVALAWRFSPAEHGIAPGKVFKRVAATMPAWRRWAAMGTASAGVFLLVFAGFRDPPGSPKRGRVLVDEFHSKWEPTQRPYDTEWYGNESGYNYAVIYDYLDHFYSMGRISTPIDDQLLSTCDVLVSKVPTERYAPAEVDAIERFVRKGGGLLLVGEHTDVFGTGVSLNDVSKRFGFTFRYDVILDTDTSFQQAMEMPLIRHPILQRLPSFDFAVSCSVDPGLSAGQPVVVSRSLRGLGPDYHASNFYPQVDDAADERFGSFVQCWATRQGRGRVVAWTDSTVWSNFCTFEPGKAELMLGLVGWLNVRNNGVDPRLLLWPAALALLGISLALGRRCHGGWLPLLCAALLGWALAVPALAFIHLKEVPAAPLQRKLKRVIIDRTVCNTVLSKGGFIEGKADGFGIFERWILRLGYFTRRSTGTDAFHDNLLVFMYPTANVPTEFREGLVDYVRRGGKVLILDSPENTNSSANSLLFPFDLKVNHQNREGGDLAASNPHWPTATVTAACEIVGGEALYTLNGKNVAATARMGQGSVTVIGFGSRFGDASMGVTGDTLPDADLAKTYAAEFALMRSLVDGTEPTLKAIPATSPATAPSTRPQD